MKRLIVFLLILLTFAGIYNFSTIRHSVSGFFGDVSYQKENLLDAKKHYEDILKNYPPLSPLGEGSGVRVGNMLLKADTLYNLGNTLYKLGEKEHDDRRMQLWKESIGNYAQSLSLRPDTQTEENLAFVQEKLKNAEKEQEQKKEEKQKKKDEQQKKDEEKKTGSGSDTKDNIEMNSSVRPENKDSTGTGNTKNKTQSGQNWSNGGSYNSIGWQDTDSVHSNLSDADRQEVQKYIESLKQFEKQNGKLLNPDKWGAGSISDQIRDFFWNDSFFQDVLPGNEWKKDW